MFAFLISNPLTCALYPFLQCPNIAALLYTVYLHHSHDPRLNTDIGICILTHYESSFMADYFWTRKESNEMAIVFESHESTII